MHELIPLQLQTIDGDTVETVSARELHSFLESRQDFSNWIKNRIERYEFVENQDFIKLNKKIELSKSGTNLLKTKIISRSTEKWSEWLVVRIC